jgi:hypothetical protein
MRKPKQVLSGAEIGIKKRTAAQSCCQAKQRPKNRQAGHFKGHPD